MTGDQKEGNKMGTPNSSKTSPVHGKEPAQAFSNVSNTMSDCSPKDRPTSVESPTRRGTPGSNSMNQVTSLTVSEHEGKREEESVSEYSEQSEEESEEESKERSRTVEGGDESESVEDIIKINGSSTKPPMVTPLEPTAIYPEESDSVGYKFDATGPVTFWRNTNPMPGFRRLFDPRWKGIVIDDEGTPAYWPPPEPQADVSSGPVIAAVNESHNELVRDMAGKAMERERIRVVHFYDPQWPHQTFARINDLDRSLADVATRLIVQAARTETSQAINNNNTFEQRRVERTNDFIIQTANKEDEIGQEFGSVADDFADLAEYLDGIKKIMKDPQLQSPALQSDLNGMKGELRLVCDRLKQRLSGLKGQIDHYGGVIGKHTQDLEKEDRERQQATISKQEEDTTAMRHRVANQRVKLLKQDMERDIGNDGTGVLAGWYDQSRLRRVLDSIEQKSGAGMKEVEEEERMKNMKFVLPKFEWDSKSSPKAIRARTASKAGGFAERAYVVDEPSSYATKGDTDEDDRFDFYKTPERFPTHERANITQMDTTKTPGQKPTKMAESSSTISSGLLGFYTAREPEDPF